MKINCICGNVLRDQRDHIPYKAHFVADQDYEELSVEIEQQLARILTQGSGTSTVTNQTQSLGRVLWDAMDSHTRTLYQCSNCGRICLEDPHDPRKLEWFKPEDNKQWKLVLASVKGEGSKVWMRNLIGHWDPSRSHGRLWFDPPTGEKGGFEQFADWSSLHSRYHELFEQLKADGNLAGARLGIGSEGESIRDVHNWSRRAS
jgi:hypothetical protein